MKKLTTVDPQSILHTSYYDSVNNEIYLFGSPEQAGEDIDEPGVEYIMANKFIINLHMAVARSKESNRYKPIIIHMKTNGGVPSEGFAIYDAIKSVPNKVTIVAYSHARSMSSIILQAADRRIMMPSSYFMFHRGTVEYSGTVQEVESNVEFDKREDHLMKDAYAQRMREKGVFKGKSRATIKAWLDNEMVKRTDVFLTPELAIKYGLADEMFTTWKRVRR